jgi:hypothetical protein
MNKTRKLALLGLSAAALSFADLAPEAPLGVGFVREAAAIIGAPLTPMSYAGVARRTTRRTVYAASAATAAAATTAAAASSQQHQQQQYQQQAVPPPPAPGGALPVGTVVSALPGGCQSAPVGGVQYYVCGGVFYRPAFQGNNLVYVVSQP